MRLRYWWTCKKCGLRNAGHPVGGECSQGGRHSYDTPADGDVIREEEA